MIITPVTVICLSACDSGLNEQTKRLIEIACYGSDMNYEDPLVSDEQKQAAKNLSVMDSNYAELEKILFNMENAGTQYFNALAFGAPENYAEPAQKAIQIKIDYCKDSLGE